MQKYIKLFFLYLFIAFIFVYCNNNHSKKRLNEAIDIFYTADMEALLPYLSDSGKLFMKTNIDTCNFEFSNKYKVKINKIKATGGKLFAIAKINNDKIQLECINKSDTLFLVLNENNFVELIKNEPLVCLQIGKHLYNLRKLSFAKSVLHCADSSTNAETKYYLGLIAFLERDYEMALYYFKNSYENGFLKAGVNYFTELIGRGKIDEGNLILKEAAEKGDPYAMYRYGDHLQTLYEVKQREQYGNTAFLYFDTVALNWYLKAIEKGDELAILNLAGQYASGMYINLIGGKKRAFELYNKAAQMNSRLAMESVGDCYFYAEGVGQNIDSGFYWYKQAAQAGNISVFYKMGYIYFEGVGVPKDNFEAYRYFKKGAELGDDDAKSILEKNSEFFSKIINKDKKYYYIDTMFFRINSRGADL